MYIFKGDTVKGIVLIMDGMGDRPIKELNNQTPLQAANTPNMDKWLKRELQVLWIL